MFIRCPVRYHHVVRNATGCNDTRFVSRDSFSQTNLTWTSSHLFKFESLGNCFFNTDVSHGKQLYLAHDRLHQFWYLVISLFSTQLSFNQVRWQRAPQTRSIYLSWGASKDHYRQKVVVIHQQGFSPIIVLGHHSSIICIRSGQSENMPVDSMVFAFSYITVLLSQAFRSRHLCLRIMRRDPSCP